MIAIGSKAPDFNLFNPLDMASCGFGAPATVDTTDAPWGHRTAASEHTPGPPGPAADNPPALGPAGTVHCTLRDWARFAQLHLRGARREPTPYLRPESFARLHTPSLTVVPSPTYARKPAAPIR